MKRTSQKLLNTKIHKIALINMNVVKEINIAIVAARILPQSCKSGRAFRVGLGFGPGSGRVRASLLGKLRAFFGPDTMLSKNKIILLLYIYSMYTNLVLHSCRP